jgi:hypothetical protein
MILVYIRTYGAQTHLYVADYDGGVVTLKHENVIAAVASSHQICALGITGTNMRVSKSVMRVVCWWV